MKIRPLADKVLVQRLEAETTTAGGIVLPDSAKEKPQRGKIVSVGEGKMLDDGTGKPDDQSFWIDVTTMLGKTRPCPDVPHQHANVFQNLQRRFVNARHLLRCEEHFR